MKARATILGCGNSTGVPAIGNYWGDCNPDNPKNNRLRSSLLLQSPDTTIVVDTGPDFRQQINREDVMSINGALYTHCHGDHINGIDELRIFRFRSKELVPVYANRETMENLSDRFDYLFQGGNIDLYPPIVDARIIERKAYGSLHKFGDIEFTPYEQDHGSMMSLGYRFGDLGYSLDMVQLDIAAVEALKGIKNWVVDAAGYKFTDNKVHANLETIFALNEQIGAERVWLSSLSISMDYDVLCNELPDHIRPCYDGMTIDVEL